MESLTVDLLANHSNCPVVKHPGRKYPGIILQGDSLQILHSMAQQIRIAATTGDPELPDLCDELSHKLAGYVALYEEAMDRHNLQLPY